MGFDIGKAWNNHIVRPVDGLRNQVGLFDHVLAMLGHYGRVNGGGLAGAVTYYAFLAFFPLIALAFFIVGYLARIYPEAREDLTEGINTLLAGLVGDGPGQISIEVFADNAGTAGVLALVGFVYSGIGLMSSMRMALQQLFVNPQQDRPNFIIGKLRDLATLSLAGLMMLVSFTITTGVNRWADEVASWIGMDWTLASRIVQLLGWLFAIVVVTGLLMLLYKFLARPTVARRALIEGSMLAAIGFVVLKVVTDRLIQATHGNPAFTVFGVALVVLVMLNYFMQVIMYGAAWAYTAPRESNSEDSDPDTADLQ